MYYFFLYIYDENKIFFFISGIMIYSIRKIDFKICIFENIFIIILRFILFVKYYILCYNFLIDLYIIK